MGVSIGFRHCRPHPLALDAQAISHAPEPKPAVKPHSFSSCCRPLSLFLQKVRRGLRALVSPLPPTSMMLSPSVFERHKPHVRITDNAFVVRHSPAKIDDIALVAHVFGPAAQHTGTPPLSWGELCFFNYDARCCRIPCSPRQRSCDPPSSANTPTPSRFTSATHRSYLPLYCGLPFFLSPHARESPSFFCSSYCTHGRREMPSSP